MKKSDKNKIKQTVATAISMILKSLKISNPSKRTVKALSKGAKALRKGLEKAYRKQSKRKAATTKPIKRKIVKKKGSVRRRVTTKKQTPRNSGRAK